MTKRTPRKVLWLRIITHIVALAPLALLVWAFGRDHLGPDPIKEATWRTGRYALIFLILSLVPTVVGMISRFKAALRIRRTLGLYAFAYAALHFLIVAGLDFGFDSSLLLQAIIESRRDWLGLAALVILLLLTATSTTSWMKRLGKNWKRLHRLVYLAGALAVAHYVYRFKELRAAPILAGVALGVLLVARLPFVASRIRAAR